MEIANTKAEKENDSGAHQATETHRCRSLCSHSDGAHRETRQIERQTGASDVGPSRPVAHAGPLQ